MDEILNNKNNIEIIRIGINEDLDAYHKYYKEKNSFGVQNRLFMLIRKYSSSAILKFLVDGDKHAFFELCYNSTACFDIHNDYCKIGMPHEKSTYSLIDPIGFFTGLISVGKDKARRLARAIYPECRYSEDEFMFCFVYGLCTMLFDDEKDIQKDYLRLLKEFRDEGRDADIEIGIFEGLLSKDEDTFVESMGKYLARREEQINKKENINIGEEYVSIEALGIIRLAQDLGLQVQIRHRLTPLELQSNYPDIKTFNREAPVINAEEVDNPEFWEDWKAVENVL